MLPPGCNFFETPFVFIGVRHFLSDIKLPLCKKVVTNFFALSDGDSVITYRCLYIVQLSTLLKILNSYKILLVIECLATRH